VIEPVIATTEDVLEVVLVTESVDADGDEVTYQISWFQSESERTDLGDWTVPADATSKGERWEVRVVASDGSLESGAAQAWVEIQNTAPRFASLSLIPESPLTSDDLVLDYSVEDPDGDPVELAFVWTVDGEETWHTDASIPAHATTRGEVWSAEISISDGTDQAVSEPVEASIGNTPPPPPLGVSVLPTEPTTDDSLLCNVETDSVDIDGETIGYSIDWLVDDQVFADAVSATFPGDTVPASNTLEGQIWSCAATPTDGSDEGDAGASEPVEVTGSEANASE